MSCCWQREKSVKQNLFWKFKHGTCVSAPTFDEAVKNMENVSKRDFWASETYEGNWDVQLSDSIVHHDIKAKSVLEAVDKARWNTRLDSSFKCLEESVICKQKSN